jgi:hypothetical protein
LRNCSIEIEINKIEESIRICKLNIENKQRKLISLINKVTAIQFKIESISLITSNELEELINIDNQLMANVNLEKSLILEFEGSLNLYETQLQNLKANPICSAAAES